MQRYLSTPSWTISSSEGIPLDSFPTDFLDYLQDLRKHDSTVSRTISSTFWQSEELPLDSFPNDFLDFWKKEEIRLHTLSWTISSSFWKYRRNTTRLSSERSISSTFWQSEEIRLFPERCPQLLTEWINTTWLYPVWVLQFFERNEEIRLDSFLKDFHNFLKNLINYDSTLSLIISSIVERVEKPRIVVKSFDHLCSSQIMWLCY